MSPAFVYGLSGVLSLAAAGLVLAMRRQPAADRLAADRPSPADRGSARWVRSTPTLAGGLEGLRFVGRTQILLGAIALDLLAVLFGGAVALLPIFARSILHIGPTGLGILRAAPAVGALLAAAVLTRRPLGGAQAGRCCSWSACSARAWSCSGSRAHTCCR